MTRNSSSAIPIVQPRAIQEAEWQTYGLDVSRRTLINWVNVASHEWLSGLYQLLHKLILQEDIAHADETVYQIINRSDDKPGRVEARIWQMRTTHGAKTPIIYY